MHGFSGQDTQGRLETVEKKLWVVVCRVAVAEQSLAGKIVSDRIRQGRAGRRILALVEMDDSQLARLLLVLADHEQSRVPPV